VQGGNAVKSSADLLNAALGFLGENNISRPRIRSSYGGSYSAGAFPNPGNEIWNASGMDNSGIDPELYQRLLSILYPMPQQQYDISSPIPHETAHIFQHRRMGPKYAETALKERQLYGQDVYQTPWTLENDAAVGLGRMIEDMIRQRALNQK
jgi:hypothetical protein